MLATEIDPENPRGVIDVELHGDDEPLTLLRSVAIYGPNASGKTNLIRAADALGALLGQSLETPSDEPMGLYVPFRLNAQSAERPVMLGIRAVVERRVYEYVIEYERAGFLSEKLKRIDADGSELLFDRAADVVTGSWTTHPQFALVLRSFRSNKLLLSLADAFAPDLAGEIAVGFRRLLAARNPTWTHPMYAGQEAAQRAHQDKSGFGQWMLEWLQAADFGIVDYNVNEVEGARGRGKELSPNEEIELELLHATDSAPVRLKWQLESEDTRRMLQLLPFIYDLSSARRGQAYFIDEISASMHPKLFAAILREFNSDVLPDSGTGQLIFTTHDTTVIDGEARSAPLRRDQIYFTEKDASGASRLYSLAEFRERQTVNLRKRYLQGRYGALPVIGRFGT